MAHIQLIGVAEIKSPDGKIWKFPYAFPIIIRELLKTNHTFNVIDTHLHKKTSSEMLDFLKTCEAKVYGISAFSHNYAFVKEMCRLIKAKHPDSIIIVGGIISGNHAILIDKANVDIVCTAAEGEKVLPELLDAIDAKSDLRTIRGIAFKDKTSNEIIKTADRGVMTREEYQKTAMPAYEYFDRELKELAANVKSLQNVPVRAFPVLTMRGCPFNCTFCGHLYGRHFLRKDWNRFFDELEFLMNRYGFEGFYSFDTNMFLNEKDADEYCRIYSERNHSFKINIELRPTFGDDAMFKKLKQHGAAVILFGIESGSQEMLDRMKKQFNIAKMKQVFKAAIDADLMMHGNFIFGTPGENKKTIRETVDFMLWLEKLLYEQKQKFTKKGKPCTSGYGWSVLVPSPTSELYDIALKKGLIKDEEEYLLSLSDDKVFRLAKGSKYKIALAHIGGDVNMSEFPSKDALLAYVHYVNALVKFKAMFFSGRNVSRDFAVQMAQVVITYMRYLASSCMTFFTPGKPQPVAK